MSCVTSVIMPISSDFARWMRRNLPTVIEASREGSMLAAGKPTLVILGGRDHFYGDRSAPRYRAAGAEVRVLPDSGHSPFVELPAEAAAVVAEFAARVPVAET